MRRLHAIMQRIGDYVFLILKRLPTIAVYTIAFFALFSVASNLINRYHVAQDKRFYQNAQPTEFVNYTSFIAQPAREGEDVTYTVCRDHDQNYRVDGVRNVYIIPEGQPEDSRVFVATKDIKNGVIDAGNCASYFIRDRDYHFTPGSYQITLNLCFRVKYDIKKCVFVKSNVFKIREPVNGSTDAQQQINNLQEQIYELQQLLDNMQPPTVSSAPSNSTRSVTRQNNAGSNSTVATTGNPGNGSNTTNPGTTTPPLTVQPPQQNPILSLLQGTTDSINGTVRGILKP